MRKRRSAVFCSSLPFSTLEHHWCHVQPLKLLANRLSSFALSPCISGVKGRCASQLMSQRAPRLLPLRLPPTNSQSSAVDTTRRSRKPSAGRRNRSSATAAGPAARRHRRRLGLRHLLLQKPARKQAARCELPPLPPALTVHPCNQIMPAEGPFQQIL
ncbi:uncharacterized protein V6R79_022218 [Siganus canaliculatus]